MVQGKDLQAVVITLATGDAIRAESRAMTATSDLIFSGDR